MISEFNFIVLEIVVIAVLLVLVLLGVFKGLKHTLINFVLLLGSVALSFAPFMGVVRKAIADVLGESIKLRETMASGAKIGFFTSLNLMAAVILTLLVYVLARVIKLLICMSVKRGMKKRNELVRPPRAVSRVFGGILGLLLNGLIVLALLFTFEMPLIGGNKTIEKTTVTKTICKLDDVVLDKLVKKDLVREKVLLALLDGNVYQLVSDERAEDLKNVTELLLAETDKVASKEEVEDYMVKFESLLRFVKDTELTEKRVEKDGFEKAVEETRNEIQEMLNALVELHEDGQPKIQVENADEVRELLAVVLDGTAAAKFNEAFTQKAE